MTINRICTNIVITMQTQIIFQAGNSSVVAIPKYLMEDLNLSVGSKVVVDKADDNSVIIKRTSPSKTKKGYVDAAFKKWLGVFLKENGEILDELAER